MTSDPAPAGPLVGYYVHHQGRGHLHRALALGAGLRSRGTRVVFLSSLPPPPGAGLDPDDWVLLARDDDGEPTDARAGGLLHWAPRHHRGLRERMAAVSRFLDGQRPDVVVSDVSQEVTMLCRLHGVPVVSVVLPGHRGDPAHTWGLGVSDRLVGFWPATATQMVSGLPPGVRGRLVAVGAMSRFPPAAAGARAPAGAAAGAAARLLVLSGLGGDAWSDAELDALTGAVPDWEVTVLGPRHWVEDPWPLLLGSDVVVTRAGQASVAEVAAARVPAVVVAAPRPHDEQVHTAAQLARGTWPAVVRRDLVSPTTAADVAAAGRLDGTGWADWCDGGAAGRFADVVDAVLARDAVAS